MIHPHLKPLSILKEWLDNYNRNDIHKIAVSIRRFGFNTALRVWQNNIVMAGNHTLKALCLVKEEGPIPDLDRTYPPDNIVVDGDEWYVHFVDVSHLDETEAKAYAIADNNLARQAVADEKLLAQYLQDVRKQSPTLMQATGFTDQTLDALITKVLDRSKRSHEDIPEPEVDHAEILRKKWGVEFGQLWEIPSIEGEGIHKLLCGDSSNPQTPSRILGTEKCDIAFTSPPYNIGDGATLNGNRRGRDTKYIGSSPDDMDEEQYLKLLIDFTQLALNVCRYVFVNIQQLAGNKREIISYLHHYKQHFVDVAIWCKTNAAPAMAPQVMTSAFEYIFIFAHEENPSRAIQTADFRGTVSNVYTASGNGSNPFASVHGAAFPLHFPEWVLMNFSRRGAMVLDPFCGLGTTLLVCEQLGRVGRGIEIDPRYVAVSLQRLSNMGLSPRLVTDEVLT